MTTIVKKETPKISTKTSGIKNPIQSPVTKKIIKPQPAKKTPEVKEVGLHKIVDDCKWFLLQL
jgi:hypothetical protein